jgi:tRNA U38,U39,U40 pseudouridine synthase TruA
MSVLVIFYISTTTSVPYHDKSLSSMRIPRACLFFCDWIIKTEGVALVHNLLSSRRACFSFFLTECSENTKTSTIRDVMLNINWWHNLQVSREFHPNFSAKWRRYLYIFPLDEDAKLIPVDEQSSIILENPEYNIAPRSFDVVKVDQIIRQLKGKMLSYKMFARDTQASRSA